MDLQIAGNALADYFGAGGVDADGVYTFGMSKWIPKDGGDTLFARVWVRDPSRWQVQLYKLAVHTDAPNPAPFADQLLVFDNRTKTGRPHDAGLVVRNPTVLAVELDGQ